MNERTIIIAPDGRMRCGRCSFRLRKADEHHPLWYCVLVKAGLDPHKEVREAAKHLPPAVPVFVPRPVAYGKKRLEAAS